MNIDDVLNVLKEKLLEFDGAVSSFEGVRDRLVPVLERIVWECMDEDYRQDREVSVRLVSDGESFSFEELRFKVYFFSKSGRDCFLLLRELDCLSEKLGGVSIFINSACKDSVLIDFYLNGLMSALGLESV